MLMRLQAHEHFDRLLAKLARQRDQKFLLLAVLLFGAVPVPAVHTAVLAVVQAVVEGGAVYWLAVLLCLLHARRVQV